MASPESKKPDGSDDTGKSVPRSLAALNGAPAEPIPSPAPDDGAAKGEVGGPEGPDPTRYGDWERKGRCIDF